MTQNQVKQPFLIVTILSIYYLIFNSIALTESNGKVLNLEASEEISERITIQAFNHMIFRVTYWEFAIDYLVLCPIPNPQSSIPNPQSPLIIDLRMSYQY